MVNGFHYFRLLEEKNDFGPTGVREWIFYSGMIFGSREKWWPDDGLRPTPHEGLDICYYIDVNGEMRQFDNHVRIPVIAEGKVFAVCNDFLGRSVFVEHDGLLSVYAHIVPSQSVNPGVMVKEGRIVGTVADTTGRKNRMPAHLHLSIMKKPGLALGEHLDWNFICNSRRVELFDPFLTVVRPPCRILPGRPAEALQSRSRPS